MNSAEPPRKFQPKLNILIAYPYFRHNDGWVDILRGRDHSEFRLIVDSGAFSAWNSGQTITMDEYCEFLDSIQDLRPFRAVQLDVYGDPEASYVNFLEMRRRGHDVMPVFTRGESLERLEEFYQLTDYIMFGGVAVGSKNAQYVKWFQEQNRGRAVHWLGFTSLPFVKFYKPTSVDSSSWANVLRYGDMWVLGEKLKLEQATRKDFQVRPDLKLIKKLKAVGVQDHHIRNLAFEEAWRYIGSSAELPGADQRKSTAWFCSTMASIKQSVEIERTIGTHQYLAVSIPSCSLQWLLNCWDRGKELQIW